MKKVDFWHLLNVVDTRNSSLFVLARQLETLFRFAIDSVITKKVAQKLSKFVIVSLCQVVLSFLPGRLATDFLTAVVEMKKEKKKHDFEAGTKQHQEEIWTHRYLAVVYMDVT